MKVAVRYYSRGGHVKAMAEALARGAGVEAVSIDDPNAQLTEPVDLLFIGGALYAFHLDPKLVEYVEHIEGDMVTDRAVCFGSSFLTRRPIYILQDLIKRRGITVSPQAAYARSSPNEALLDSLAYFAEVEVNRDPDLDRLPPIQYAVRAEKRRQEERAAREAAKAAAEAGELAAADADPAEEGATATSGEEG